MECRIFFRQKFSICFLGFFTVDNHNSLLTTILHPILFGLTVKVPEIYSSDCSSGGFIRFGSVSGRLVLSPRQVFGSFGELRCVISVNNLRLAFWRQESLHTFHRILCSLGSARVTVYPLSGQILYHFRFSMMQSRFVLFIDNFVIRCNCIPNVVACGILTSRLSGFPLHGALVIFVRLHISLLGSFGKWVHKRCFLQVCSRVSLEDVVEELFLGIVSPALPDDPDPLPTSPSVKGLSQSGISCSRSHEAVGTLSSDAPSASLRGLVSAIVPGK